MTADLQTCRNVAGLYDSREGAEYGARMYSGTVVHVREVVE